MCQEFEPLNKDDVVAVESDTFEDLDITRTSKVVHLLVAIQECFGGNTPVATLFSEEGLECEVLKLGANTWQQGKIRITLEFCPTQEIESSFSLNNIHQNLQDAENNL